MKKIHKLLIANRGEIACRVMRTCRELGILSVAVYSEIDSRALFVKTADEAVCIGSSGIETYLDQEGIIRAAIETSSDAIHPGYGLLSENPDFALRCRDENIIFIGPSPESITLMGSKIAARELCGEIGVPVIPGFRITNEPATGLAGRVARIGYPVLIKASEGGGGIGIFLVEGPEELERTLESARKKSLAAYGNDNLLIEKYLPSVRHIEFQVMGDAHGNIVHLFERECSVQRRHQKLLEESPSPAVTAELRKSMGDAAVTIAGAAEYSNAGTVEFVLAEDGAFYFLEMNTRLQVEHPVTEAVTGLDLVAMQIAIAEGEPIGIDQESLSMNGHAIECRIYAEDPDNEFFPSAGTLHVWKETPGARTDSGVDPSSRLTIDFDPLMAKVIVHADSRSNAIRKMSRALRETAALGVATNIDFLSRLLSGEPYVKGEIRTDFFAKAGADVLKPSLTQEDTCLLVSAAIAARFDGYEEGHRELGWQGAYRRMKYAGFLLNGAEYSAAYRKKDAERFEIAVGTDTFDVFLAEKGADSIVIVVNGRRQRFSYADDGETVFLHGINLGHHQLKHLSRFETMEFLHRKGTREAPMDGKVASVKVQPGEKVNKGQDLLVIESMKMENIIQADREGLVKEVFVKTGDFVKMGSLLIEIDVENDV